MMNLLQQNPIQHIIGISPNSKQTASMNKKTKTLHLNQLNYRLLVAVVFTLLVPTLYNTFRIYLIGDIPSEWGFNIASQIAWLNIIYEVLQEAIILPLFFVLGSLVTHTRFFARKSRMG